MTLSILVDGIPSVVHDGWFIIESFQYLVMLRFRIVVLAKEVDPIEVGKICNAGRPFMRRFDSQYIIKTRSSIVEIHSVEPVIVKPKF